METITIERETRVFIGRPSQPMPAERIAALGRELARIEEVEEAYLPMVFGLPGQAQATEVLILGVSDARGRDRIAAAVGDALLAAGIPRIDCIQLRPEDPILQSARTSGCVVPLGRSPRAWWRFW